jgi:putative ABC transport system substrate-binding protein
MQYILLDMRGRGSHCRLNRLAATLGLPDNNFVAEAGARRKDLVTTRTRRHFLVGGVGLALAGTGLASAAAVSRARGSRRPQVGLLYSSLEANVSWYDAFREGMRDLGWIADENIVFETRSAGGDADRFRGLALELAQLDVDVMVASTVESTLAAMRASGNVPIVMAGVSEPQEQGLIASLARPGGRVTGMSRQQPLLAAKRLELIADSLPDIARIGVLYYPGQAGTLDLVIDQLSSTARVRGVDLVRLEVTSADEFQVAFERAVQATVGALIVPASVLFTAHRKQLCALAAGYRLPTLYPAIEYVQAGGLMCYGENLPALHRRVATYVDRILRGAEPSTLPIEQPTVFDLAVNVRTARSLGFDVPPQVAAQVTRWLT